MITFAVGSIEILDPKASEILAYIKTRPRWRPCGCPEGVLGHYHTDWAPYGKGGFTIQPAEPKIPTP